MMNNKIRFTSIRLALVIFIASCAVLLLQNFYSSNSADFFTASISAVIGFAVVLLYFLPSAIIKKHTNLDFISFANRETPSAVIFVAAYYAMYFVFIATGFLVKYTDMFESTINSETNVYVVAMLLIAVSAYAAYKGINVISRTAIFIFIFLIVTFIVIFSGNISNLDFKTNSIDFKADYDSLMQIASFFASIAFVSVIFGFNSSDIKNYKSKHSVFTILSVLIAAILILMFIYFSLGSYGKMQPYQMYLVSKACHAGVISGADSFYLCAVTSAIFVLIAAILASTAKSIDCKSRMWLIILFTAVIFVLYICAENIKFVKEILGDYKIINLLNFISAVLIPTLYIFIFRRKLNV